MKKNERNFETLKRVLNLVLKKYRFSSLVVVVCIVVSAFATLYGTLFMQTLIDDYIIPLTKAVHPDFSGLAMALSRMAGVYLVGIVSSYAYNRIMVNVTQGTLKNLRIKLFTKMESLPIKYFDTHAHGNIMSTYTNDIDTLRELISQSIPQVINSSVTVVITLASMIVLNIPLTVLTLAMVGIMMYFSGQLGGQSSRYFIKQQQNIGQLNGFIEEMMEGQKVVKVFCHEQEAIADFKALNDQLRDSAYQANKFANIMMPVMGNLGNISYVLCAVVGAILALNGRGGLTLGALVSFMTLNKNFSRPVTQIAQQANSIVMAMAGAHRIFLLMDEEAEVDEGYVELVNAKIDEAGNIVESSERTGQWAWKHPHEDGTTTYRQLTGSVVLDDVDFGYSDEKMVLHNISLYAKPGQKIAFVGSTGAGKTTITNLINRFYDIQDGKIRYDDININKIRKADLRRSLGIVLQDTHLFTGTVMENIRYGNLEASDAQCIEACQLANADGFIRRLPDGYQTMLSGDGANLSQGQRQLLAIARAAVANPPALILDEATSSIDTRTETLVQQGMDALMKARTTFVIAHRLSTVRNADCIVVLEQGRIIEKGNHDELMAKKGRYYQLYTGNSIAE